MTKTTKTTTTETTTEPRRCAACEASGLEWSECGEATTVVEVDRHYAGWADPLPGWEDLAPGMQRGTWAVPMCDGCAAEARIHADYADDEYDDDEYDDDDIEALLREAGGAGDTEMAEIASRALAGGALAYAECVRVMRRAVGERDEDVTP